MFRFCNKPVFLVFPKIEVLEIHIAHGCKGWVYTLRPTLTVTTYDCKGSKVPLDTIRDQKYQKLEGFEELTSDPLTSLL